MANRPRRPMPISERAKIFAPFAALKGLDEALAEKEKIRVEKKEISEDMAEEINFVLKSLKTGDIVTVIYYEENEMRYIQITGNISKIDKYNRILQINLNEISFEDLFSVAV